jgi:predicted aspartyl protease
MPKKRQVLGFLLAISGCFGAEPLAGRLGTGAEALLDSEPQPGPSRVTGERADSELRSLFAARDWFKLRDAVERSANVPAFYRGAVACAFNDVDSGERHFRAVFKASGEVEQAAEAHGLLAHAYMRSGRYRQTYAHLAAMQRLLPEVSGLKSALALFSALSGQRELSVKTRRPSDVRMTDDFFIPVAVNGKPAQYGFDSGMDISFISEAEANRLGLSIHEVGAATLKDGASGNDVPVRFVVADRLTVGGFELRNVVFTVAQKGAMPFVELPPEKQGILGVPALVAFGTMRWNSDRVLQIGMDRDRRDAQHSNMCFQAVTPVVEGTYRAQRINAWLDTGSSKTYLTQRFARQFPDVIEAGGKEASVRLRGIGGSTEVRVTTVPEIKFIIGGADLAMRPAEVLPKDERVDRDWYDIWLGMDLLGQMREISLDFKSLTFSLR